jgi:UDP-N-acetylglucosamine--N-acetylmuramyl-(pentapeptide) pyrophosphoryl-undecaprenol N-acetylglucosamine transferase
LESLQNVDTRQLLVLGGSGGARSLNEMVPRALCLIRDRLQDWKVLHQSGEAACEATQKLYEKFGLSAEVVPFIANMPGALAQTSLAICRAGGSTLAELAASATPAILIPYPYATNDHQRKNAELFHHHGGCGLLDEREHGCRLDKVLACQLSEFIDDESRRCRVSHTMRCLARPEAAHQVAKIIFGQIR